MVELFANSGDPDQMQNAASDLRLHCLPNTVLRISQLQWVNGEIRKIIILCFRKEAIIPKAMFIVVIVGQMQPLNKAKYGI